MRERHHIDHTTIQIEKAEDAAAGRPVQLLP
jgi:hypothetical protein